MKHLLVSVFSIAALFLLGIASISRADMLIGGETSYVVQKGDCLIMIGARLGVNWRSIVKENNIDICRILKIGEQFKVNTRRIVPKVVSDGIIVNIPEGMLYFFKHDRLEAFPVGLGQSDKEWKTPVGKFTITDKEKYPTWHVPKSIQEEMGEKGMEILITVEPGDNNPLGRYAFKTSLSDILIHETIWPTSVHQFRSHGCIRVLPEHMEKLYPQVTISMQGEILYEPVKIARTAEGRVFLEVHQDIYKRVASISEEVKKHLEKRGLSDKVDWQKINTIVDQKAGIAEDITL